MTLSAIIPSVNTCKSTWWPVVMPECSRPSSWRRWLESECSGKVEKLLVILSVTTVLLSSCQDQMFWFWCKESSNDISYKARWNHQPLDLSSKQTAQRWPRRAVNETGDTLKCWCVCTVWCVCVCVCVVCDCMWCVGACMCVCVVWLCMCVYMNAFILISDYDIRTHTLCTRTKQEERLIFQSVFTYF